MRNEPGKYRNAKIAVFGVFDILHPGHLSFLESAKRRGGRLIVIVTRDRQVRAQKGRPTYFKEKERLAMVRSLKPVDRAILGDAGRRWTVVRRLGPDVICIGYDQRADHPEFLRQLASMRKRPRLVRLRAAHPDRYKSSKLRLEVH